MLISKLTRLEKKMMEKIYLKMTHSGILSVIGGVCAIIIGFIMIISGGILLKNKKNILF